MGGEFINKQQLKICNKYPLSSATSSCVCSHGAFFLAVLFLCIESYLEVNLEILEEQNQEIHPLNVLFRKSN